MFLRCIVWYRHSTLSIQFIPPLGLSICNRLRSIPTAHWIDTRNTMSSSGDSALTWNRQGMELARLGRFDDAAHCSRQALALDANSAAGHNNLGGIAVLQGRFAEAVDCYRAALKL